MDYSAEALEQFLEYLADKGKVPRATIVSRKAACNKMLGILSADERRDLRELDLEELAVRFQNLEGMNYTGDSLKTYKSRVSVAIDDFIRFKENPSTFRVKQSAQKRSSPRSGDAAQGSMRQASSVDTMAPNQAIAPQVPHHRNTHGMAIPVPIRADLIVTLSNVPFDLSSSEAQKIANVILALAGTDSS